MQKNVVSISVIFGIAILVAAIAARIPSGLQALSILWVLHMGYRVYQIYGVLPEPWVFTIRPFSEYPDYIDRGDRHLPVPTEKSAIQTHGDKYIYDLAVRINNKIRHATSESNVVAFVGSMIERLRRRAEARYPRSLMDSIDAVAWEGAVGSLIGLATFVILVSGTVIAAVHDSDAQTTIPASHFASIVAAVLCGVIGSVGKTALRQEVNERKEGEIAQIEALRVELDTNFASRLRIQDQMMHRMLDLHTVETALADQVRGLAIMADELRGSASETTKLIDRVNSELAPALKEGVALARRLSGMEIEIRGTVAVSPKLPPT